MRPSIRQAVLMLSEVRGAMKLGVVSPADVVKRLDGIERVLEAVERPPAPLRRDGLVAARRRQRHGYAPNEMALLTIDRMGGNVSPLGLGHALEPTWETPRASTFGSNLLTALRQRGLVVRSGHARWTITPNGLAEVRRLQGRGAAA